ncbi:hypothetical protein [Treponema pectinovorum]|uniref:hypothetical protein n=1 Tax=Treponema pectinovorum TaxID=164 RepID=UPI0011CC4185|nr:hypothetical protein [Treponema pectinovorum]
MLQSEIVFYVIKLVLGGVIAFLAISVWNRTRDVVWMALASGFIISYAALVYELLVKLGIAGNSEPNFFGISIVSLLFFIVPSVFFIVAFVLLILKSK